MIRRGMTTCILAAAALLLTGCGLIERWFGSANDPRPIVEWAESNAVSVGPAPSKDPAGKTVISLNARNGYEFRSSDTNALTTIYFIPLERLDPSYEATLRKLAFPGGTATVRGAGGGSPVKLSESEIDKFYVNVFVGHDISQCDNFAKRCDAVFSTAIVVKLKNVSLTGDHSQGLAFDIFKGIDNDRLMAGHVGDATSICGFDPNKDRLPDHVARGCDAVRLLSFAADNGFTVLKTQGLVPMTPDALKMAIAEFLSEPMYEDGVARAGLVGSK